MVTKITKHTMLSDHKKITLEISNKKNSDPLFSIFLEIKNIYNSWVRRK